MRIKKLWERYNPRRKFIDLDDATIEFMAQLGYIELYRGEWLFTKEGREALEYGIRVYTEKYNADVRS